MMDIRRYRGRFLLLGAAISVAVTVTWSAAGAWSGSRSLPSAQTAGSAGSGGDMDMGADEAAPMSDMVMGADGVVRMDPAMARSLGVVTVAAELGPVNRSLRATGTVTYDETRLSTITPKFGGFVERLYVDNTGQSVRRGQPVLDIYSPELVSAQEELLAAVRLEESLAGSAAPGVAERSSRLAESARRKLLLWDISPAQIERIERTGEVRRTLTLHSPYPGFVVEKQVQSGQSVAAGAALYRLADLSTVWVDADVYEHDLRFVQVGAAVEVEIAAYPGELLLGRVAYIHPDVRPDTRTVRVRVELANPGARIKPGMFAMVSVALPIAARAVLVPRDAVMRTGARDLVFVEVGAGAYEPRPVRVGTEAGERTQILSGLLAGERVVARANFLLDAESRLMEAMGGMDMQMDVDIDMDSGAAGMPDMDR